MSDIEVEVLEDGNAVRHNAPDFVRFYANNASFGTNLWDIRILFSEFLGNASDERMILERRALVVMSPLHAKAFASLMNSAVEQYEARFGEIKFPSSNKNLEEQTDTGKTGEATTEDKRTSKKKSSKKKSG